MNERELMAKLVKKNRRSVMRTLLMWYPNPVDFADLAVTLPNIEEDNLKRNLAYLIDKGYVRWINETKNAAWANREYVLTASGEEVAQSIKIDSALEP